MKNEALKKYMETEFDAGRTAQELVGWIRDWFSENGPSSPAVVGLSGGKDSTLVACLCVRALGAERVFGVLMPDHEQADFGVAKDIAEWLGIRHAVINIGSATDGVRCSIGGAELYQGRESGLYAGGAAGGPGGDPLPGIGETEQMLTNIPPRIRMTTLYAVAQTMNGRVSNNSNRSEKYVGYGTIYGDTAGDFSPLANLTVTEAVALGEYLGIPDRFIHKEPSDGLTGKTDEEAFGFTYEALDTYILTGVCGDEKVKALIDRRHRANLFKLKPIAAYEKRNRTSADGGAQKKEGSR